MGIVGTFGLSVERVLGLRICLADRECSLLCWCRHSEGVQSINQSIRSDHAKSI